jgi:hypothetical protein
VADYSKITQDDFETILTRIVEGMSAAQILAVPGAAEALREELNNEVLEAWEEEQEEEDSDDCPTCGGSGGGLPPCQCSVCGGTRIRR